MARKPRQTFPIGSDESIGPSSSPALSTGAAKPPGSQRRAPMFAKGAASLENAVKSAAAEDRMYRLLSIELIDPSPIRDRIDLSENLEDLKRSLADEGQQIPILVRPKVGTDRYEIVTGRRRLQATRELGQTRIQAFVRSMNDEEAFIAQGVENNARLETSFIERARTILSALEAGFTQTQVEKFLNVDQTMVSRMKTIYSGIGEAIVMAIGPARGIGRRKWERLQKLVGESRQSPEVMIGRIQTALPDSSDRFEAFLGWMEQHATPAPAPQKSAPTPPVPSIAGGRLTAVRKGDQLVIKARKTAPDGFLEYLANQLPMLLDRFEAKADEASHD